jgi:hypothetical protein
VSIGVVAEAEQSGKVKSCQAANTVPTMDPMSEPEQLRAESLTLPLRPQDEVECRLCEVHCDKVVYPSACLERSCPFVYAYGEHGHTYMGCMQKVFTAEIDLEMLRAAERRREGFGAVRALRPPLPMCRSDVEPCFSQRLPELGCTNPEFNELPAGSPTFRVFARLSDA